MSVTALVASSQSTNDQSGGTPEIVSVLLVIQGSLFFVAGLSALPFGIVEPSMRVEGLVTLLLAAGTFLLARGVRRHRPWARKWTLALQVLGVIGSLLLMLLPIEAMRGPVPLLTNLVLPATVFFLLVSRSGRSAFAGERVNKRRAPR